MNKMQSFWIGALLSAIIWIPFGVKIQRENIHQCPVPPPQPVDNEIIQLNDSTLVRIHVRVDTSYFVR